MTKKNLAVTSIAALLLSASLVSANGGKNNGGGNNLSVDNTNIAVASASNSNSVNVEGSAMAPGMSGDICTEGGGIGVVGFSLGGGSPKMKCIAAITAADMVKVGALTPNQGRDAWLIAVGMKLDSNATSTAGSASTASKGVPNFVGEWNSLTDRQQRAVVGCDATLNGKRTADCAN